MTQENPKITQRTPRWVKVLLAGSLAVNLLIAGAVGGAMIKGKSGDRSARVAPQGGFVAITRALPRQDRRAIGDQLRASVGQRAPRDPQVTQWIALLEADTFDLDAARVLAQTQMNDTTARRALGRDLTLDHIARMPLDRRQTMAQKLRDALQRRQDRVQN